AAFSEGGAAATDASCRLGSWLGGVGSMADCATAAAREPGVTSGRCDPGRPATARCDDHTRLKRRDACAVRNRAHVGRTTAAPCHPELLGDAPVAAAVEPAAGQATCSTDVD